jgi:mannose/fructose/N-acetylgalactosamine-specific phosphotransferase system component IID
MSILGAALSGIGSSVFGLKGMAIVGAVCLAVGTTGGAVVTSKFYVASAERQQITNLNTQIAAKQAAYDANSAALKATQDKLNVMDGVVNGLKAKISSGDCFVGDDVDAVLDLLGQSKSAASTR